jgi:hypothetical protein
LSGDAPAFEIASEAGKRAGDGDGPTSAQANLASGGGRASNDDDDRASDGGGRASGGDQTIRHGWRPRNPAGIEAKQSSHGDELLIF